MTHFVEIFNKSIISYIKMQIFYFLSHTKAETQRYECWNFNSGNYLFTTDTK